MCLREKIGPDPRNFNQRVSLGRNDLLIRTFLNITVVPSFIGRLRNIRQGKECLIAIPKILIVRVLSLMNHVIQREYAVSMRQRISPPYIRMHMLQRRQFTLVIG